MLQSTRTAERAVRQELIPEGGRRGEGMVWKLTALCHLGLEPCQGVILHPAAVEGMACVAPEPAHGQCGGMWRWGAPGRGAAAARGPRWSLASGVGWEVESQSRCLDLTGGRMDLRRVQSLLFCPSVHHLPIMQWGIDRRAWRDSAPWLPEVASGAEFQVGGPAVALRGLESAGSKASQQEGWAGQWERAGLEHPGVAQKAWWKEEAGHSQDLQGRACLPS